MALHDRLLAHAPPEEATDEEISLPGTLARAAARPFVARADELGRLREVWAEARRGEARTVLLAGEPGIGKTSLAARVALAAHEEGGAVLLGRCHREALVPYEPFVEALRQLPNRALTAHAAILGRVMPELSGDQPTGAAGPEDHATRYLLFDAVARSLENVTERRPVMLVLEDLHWGSRPRCSCSATSCAPRRARHC